MDLRSVVLAVEVLAGRGWLGALGRGMGWTLGVQMVLCIELGEQLFVDVLHSLVFVFECQQLLFVVC